MDRPEERDGPFDLRPSEVVEIVSRCGVEINRQQAAAFAGWAYSTFGSWRQKGLLKAREEALEEAGLKLIGLYRYEKTDGADEFNEGVKACVQLLAPKSGTEPSVVALDDLPPISVHSDFDGNPMPTEWPDALSEIRGLRKDNDRLAAQNQTLHDDLARQSAFRGWSAQDRFTCWINEGPVLAKEAGLYVGINVSDAIRQHSQKGER